MNENVMSQLDAELEHAGEETALSPQMLSKIRKNISFGAQK